MLPVQHVPLANVGDVGLVAQLSLEDELALVLGKQCLRLSVLHLLLAQVSHLHFLLHHQLVVSFEAPLRSHQHGTALEVQSNVHPDLPVAQLGPATDPGVQLL